jgi:hypothetical protein
MDVTALCPLPVGIVRWGSPEPILSFVVKMTLSLAQDEASLAEAQEPLSLDRPSATGGEGELYYATDFVPGKARADVLLTGHAYAERPSRAVAARFGIGGLDKRFYALAGEDVPAIPLSAAYLRAESWPGSAAVTVGPRLPGPVLPTASFDLARFNVAPVDQQVSAVRSGSMLALEGLAPGGRARQLQLPDERPRIYLRQPQGLSEVRLRCDTLWIDTTRGICVQVWRGAIPLGGGGDPDAVVTLALPGAPEAEPELHDRIAAGLRVRAVEASDLRTEAEPVGPLSDQRVTAPTLADRRGQPMALGFSRLAEAARKTEPPPAPNTLVLPSGGGADPLRAALPFRAPPGFEAPRGVHEPPAPAAPIFAPAIDSGELASPNRWGALGGDAGTAIAVQTIAPAPRPTAAALPAAPRRQKAEPAPELPLSQFATIRVALWEEGATLDGHLARHGLEELAWHDGERRLARVLAEEAANGRADQALALADAMKQAKVEASADDDVRFTLDDYVALRIALDRAAEAKTVLRAHGITAAAWQRLHRDWQARGLADPKVAAKVRAKLAAARKVPARGPKADPSGLAVAAWQKPYLGPRGKRGG